MWNGIGDRGSIEERITLTKASVISESGTVY